MSETFTVTFSNLSSYEKYKQEVISNGGTIKTDLGATLLGFVAVMPPTLVNSIRLAGFADNGITSFDPDSEVTIHAQ